MCKKFWQNFPLKTILLFCGFFSFTHCGNLWGQELEEYKTDNYLVRGKASYDQLREWGFLAEDRRKVIAHNLGFYTLRKWDSPCLLQFSSSSREFFKDSGAPNWSKGWSRLMIQRGKTSRAIWLVEQSSTSKLEPLISHEIAHLLFLEYLDFPKDLPRWLNEGVAIWSEESSRPIYNRVITKAIKKGKFIPFETFFTLKQYPKEKRLFYSQSSSIIQFLMRAYGSGEFLRFSRLIRDGESFKEAMFRIYGAQGSNMEVFEANWKSWVLENLS